MPQKKNSKAKKTGKCHVCGDTGHYAGDCKERNSGSEEAMLQDTTRKCHVCGETGHYARECKDKQSDTVKVLLPDTTRKCHLCGYTGHYARDCKERKSTRKCNTCGEPGHYARECKDKKSDTVKVVLKAIIGLGTRSNQKAQGWYLNCGSSEHVCYSKDMFVDYNPMRDHEVVLDNDDHLDVAGIGTVVIRFNTNKVLTLSNVLHIPKISKCYVSVAKLDDLGYITTIVDGMGVITKSQEVIAKAYAVVESVYQLMLKGMYVKKVIKQGDGTGVTTTTFGGGQCVIKQDDVIIQKGFKDHLLYKMDFMKEPPTAAKVKIELTIGLLMGDEHPELTKARARGWYLPPKCTMHVCNSRDMFVDYQPVTGHEAVLEDDSRVAVEGYGTVKLQLTTGKVLTLERVFHMPAISKCCISIGFLMREFGYGLGYDAHGCYVKKDDQIVGNCFIEDGMLCLDVIDERSGGNHA